MNKQPPRLGNVWTAKAQVIKIEGAGDKAHWAVISECMDTPAAIDAELARLKLQGHDVKMYWVRGDATPRQMVLDWQSKRRRS
jgi:hypothetical protein